MKSLSYKIGMKEKKRNEKRWFVRIFVKILGVLLKKGNDVLIR